MTNLLCEACHLSLSGVGCHCVVVFNPQLEPVEDQEEPNRPQEHDHETKLEHQAPRD